METENEKNFATKTNEVKDDAEFIPQQPSNNFENVSLEILAKTKNFWKRLNGVKLDNIHLEERKIELKKENEQLKEQLREYLSELKTLNGQASSNTKQIRPQSMKIERVKDPEIKNRITKRPVTSIEANLSVAVRSQKIISN